jgi:hypothetical protein
MKYSTFRSLPILGPQPLQVDKCRLPQTINSMLERREGDSFRLALVRHIKRTHAALHYGGLA